ncbi:MAG: phenylalanine--tRNA ligase subunit alpha [Candidatus Omnitrophica bacterium]|nr:phenylalanine--tRNA ligase subunit alpha [Candidatus Omnitrophota bacterium]
MTWDFEKIKLEINNDVKLISNEQEFETFRIKYLGKKGLIQEIYASLAQASSEEKPLIGKNVNEIKLLANTLLEERKETIKSSQTSANKNIFDLTLPGIAQPVGHKHLLTQTIEEICGIFEKLGFVIQEGPEVETEYNNFTALNIPADHPSRDGFDTFYTNIKDPQDKNAHLLLRSHTSPGQIRIMKEYKPPLAVIIPGKVYRPDAVDASHSFMFHQIEGLLVDENIKFSDLKGLLTTFCKKLFGNDIKMRFRPHFFPFTEPSAEVDISWKDGKKEWLEIMGCGMVHPKVFEFAGYPKGKYTGLAFGLGVERMAMLKYGINDIRLFYENDKRFLEQF